jgi:hypothetical protein
LIPAGFVIGSIAILYYCQLLNRIRMDGDRADFHGSD